MASETNLAPFSTGPFTKSATAGTPYHLVSAASTNATNVKATTGWVGFVAGYNVASSPRYLKLYDKATAPTVGTDVPKLVFMMPGNTSGTGFNITFDYTSVEFELGISFAITAGIADTDSTIVGANDCVINLLYM